ncbi:MAG: energy transducer TonB [Woeseiaceae bacterium]
MAGHDLQNDDATKLSRSSDTPLLIIALIAIVGMAAWFFLGSDGQMIEDASMVEAPIEMQEEVLSAVITETPEDDLLKRARLAVESGVLIEPVGANALYYYSLYLEGQPEDETAIAEADVVLDQVAGRIDQAFDGGDYLVAAGLVDQIRNTGLSHPVIDAFPDRIRAATDDARASALSSARDGNEQDATDRLAVYEALPGTSTGDLLALRSEVRDALDAKRLADAAAAAQRAARRQQQRRAAANASRQTAPTPVAERAAARATPATNTLDLARSQVEAAMAAGDYSSAIQVYSDVPATTEGRIELQQLLSNQLSVAVRTAASRQQLPEAEAAFAGWRSVALSTDDESELQALVDEAYIATATLETVSAATLRRVETLAPVYPRAAIRRELTGRLKLEFTVNEDGTTSGIEVVDSAAGGIFDRSAVRAVSGWRYEPREVRGRRVAQRVFAFLDYNLE